MSTDTFVDDVLPYLVAMFCVITVVVNFVINLYTLTNMRARRMFTIIANRLFIQFFVLDLIAGVFVFIPASVTSILQGWELSDFVCKIHGIAVIFVYLLSFGLLTIRCIERAIKIRNRERYKKTFLSKPFFASVSVFVWITGLGVALYPLSGSVTFYYDYYHSGCIPDLENNIVYLVILFCLGICLTFVVFVITHILIFKTPENSSSTGRIGPSDENQNRIGKLSSGKNWMSDKEQGPKTAEKRTSPNIETALTNFQICIIMMIMWAPYFIVTFLRSNDAGLWRGSYSIALVFIVLTFSVKSFVYFYKQRQTIKAKEGNRPKTTNNKDNRIMVVSRKGKRKNTTDKSMVEPLNTGQYDKDKTKARDISGKQTPVHRENEDMDHNDSDDYYSSDEWSEYDYDEEMQSCCCGRKKLQENGDQKTGDDGTFYDLEEDYHPSPEQLPGIYKSKQKKAADKKVVIDESMNRTNSKRRKRAKDKNAKRDNPTFNNGSSEIDEKDNSSFDESEEDDIGKTKRRKQPTGKVPWNRKRESEILSDKADKDLASPRNARNKKMTSYTRKKTNNGGEQTDPDSDDSYLERETSSNKNGKLNNKNSLSNKSISSEKRGKSGSNKVTGDDFSEPDTDENMGHSNRYQGKNMKSKSQVKNIIDRQMSGSSNKADRDDPGSNNNIQKSKMDTKESKSENRRVANSDGRFSEGKPFHVNDSEDGRQSADIKRQNSKNEEFSQPRSQKNNSNENVSQRTVPPSERHTNTGNDNATRHYDEGKRNSEEKSRDVDHSTPAVNPGSKGGAANKVQNSKGALRQNKFGQNPEESDEYSNMQDEFDSDDQQDVKGKDSFWAKRPEKSKLETERNESDIRGTQARQDLKSRRMSENIPRRGNVLSQKQFTRHKSFIEDSVDTDTQKKEPRTDFNKTSPESGKSNDKKGDYRSKNQDSQQFKDSKSKSKENDYERNENEGNLHKGKISDKKEDKLNRTRNKSDIESDKTSLTKIPASHVTQKNSDGSAKPEASYNTSGNDKRVSNDTKTKEQTQVGNGRRLFLENDVNEKTTDALSQQKGRPSENINDQKLVKSYPSKSVSKQNAEPRHTEDDIFINPANGLSNNPNKSPVDVNTSGGPVTAKDRDSDVTKRNQQTNNDRKGNERDNAYNDSEGKASNELHSDSFPQHKTRPQKQPYTNDKSQSTHSKSGYQPNDDSKYTKDSFFINPPSGLPSDYSNNKTNFSTDDKESAHLTDQKKSNQMTNDNHKGMGRTPFSNLSNEKQGQNPSGRTSEPTYSKNNLDSNSSKPVRETKDDFNYTKDNFFINPPSGLTSDYSNNKTGSPKESKNGSNLANEKKSNHLTNDNQKERDRAPFDNHSHEKQRGSNFTGRPSEPPYSKDHSNSNSSKPVRETNDDSKYTNDNFFINPPSGLPAEYSITQMKPPKENKYGITASNVPLSKDYRTPGVNRINQPSNDSDRENNGLPVDNSASDNTKPHNTIPIPKNNDGPSNLHSNFQNTGKSNHNPHSLKDNNSGMPKSKNIETKYGENGNNPYPHRSEDNKGVNKVPNDPVQFNNDNTKDKFPGNGRQPPFHDAMRNGAHSSEDAPNSKVGDNGKPINPSKPKGVGSNSSDNPYDNKRALDNLRGKENNDVAALAKSKGWLNEIAPTRATNGEQIGPTGAPAKNKHENSRQNGLNNSELSGNKQQNPGGNQTDLRNQDNKGSVSNRNPWNDPTSTYPDRNQTNDLSRGSQLNVIDTSSDQNHVRNDQNTSSKQRTEKPSKNNGSDIYDARSKGWLNDTNSLNGGTSNSQGKGALPYNENNKNGNKWPTEADPYAAGKGMNIQDSTKGNLERRKDDIGNKTSSNNVNGMGRPNIPDKSFPNSSGFDPYQMNSTLALGNSYHNGNQNKDPLLASGRPGFRGVQRDVMPRGGEDLNKNYSSSHNSDPTGKESPPNDNWEKAKNKISAYNTLTKYDKFIAVHGQDNTYDKKLGLSPRNNSKQVEIKHFNDEKGWKNQLPDLDLV